MVVIVPFLILLATFHSLDGKCIVVVELQPTPRSSFHLDNPDRLEKHINKYIEIIKSVTTAYDVGLIVFPEGTLDDVQTKYDLDYYSVQLQIDDNPCIMPLFYPPYIQKLSCAARDHDTVIIFNTIEEYYSSDVVIDGWGRIIFSIRRERRIGASILDHGPIPFAVPSRYMFFVPINTTKNGFTGVKVTPTSMVTGFLFSWDKAFALEGRVYVVCSNWISQLPFLTSLQVYQMWAEEFDVQLFVSGASNPGRGQGGAGIYQGSAGPVLLDVQPFGGTKAHVYKLFGTLLSTVPNKTFAQEARDMDAFHLEPDPDLYRYSSRVIPARNHSSSVHLCHTTFCCDFYYNISVATYFASIRRYTYHMVAYKGYKTYYNIFEPGGVEVCAIVACLTPEVSSCGHRFDSYYDVGWPITFEKIVIKAKFGPPVKEKIYYSSQFPNSLLSTIKPIHPRFTNWSRVVIADGGVERRFALVERQKQVLTFGIFGRNFSLEDPRSGGHKSLLRNCVVVIGLGVVLRF